MRGARWIDTHRWYHRCCTDGCIDCCIGRCICCCIRRLQEYERFKAAAEGIDGLSRVGRDVVVPKLDAPEARARKLLPSLW